MKKNSTLLVAVALGLGLYGVAQAGPTGIVNSKHNFSKAQGNVPALSTEICNVCHTPHNADPSVAAAPLWNHVSTSPNFKMYWSYTFDAGNKTEDAKNRSLGALSRLCLSCHDGSIALDAFGAHKDSKDYFIPEGPTKIGKDHDLTTTHPISFTYDDALVTDKDPELALPSSALSGLGKTIKEDMLFDSKMECPSCHDVHNGTGASKLLLKSNDGSALCLTCHIK